MELLSKYIEDKKFIHWVFDPDSELDSWWNRFMTDHPEEKRNLLLARKLLLRFRATHKKLTEEDKIILFSRILKQIEEKQCRGKNKRLVIGFMRYAAVAILFFSIGAILFYKQNQSNLQFDVKRLSDPVPETCARLIRSNGEDIQLKEDKSILRYQCNGALVVNEDTLSPDKSKPVNPDAMNQLIIPFGKLSEVLLPDGTKVFLNAGSRLVYPENFRGNQREVFLVGEAFFDVKHDADRPFIVQLNDLRVKVLGTRFNISAYPTDNVIETALVAGKVCMQKNDAGLFDKDTELVPSQLASFDRTTQKTDVKTVDTDDYILWTKGILKFESTDLNRILKKLERFYNVRFQFSDPLLGGIRISGKLELKEDKDEICERIARTASLNIIKKKEDLYEILK